MRLVLSTVSPVELDPWPAMGVKPIQVITIRTRMNDLCMLVPSRSYSILIDGIDSGLCGKVITSVERPGTRTLLEECQEKNDICVEEAPSVHEDPLEKVANLRYKIGFS